MSHFFKASLVKWSRIMPIFSLFVGPCVTALWMSSNQFYIVLTFFPGKFLSFLSLRTTVWPVAHVYPASSCLFASSFFHHCSKSPNFLLHLFQKVLMVVELSFLHLAFPFFKRQTNGKSSSSYSALEI